MKHNFKELDGVSVHLKDGCFPATVCEVSAKQVIVKFDKVVVHETGNVFERVPSAAEVVFTVRKDGSVKKKGSSKYTLKPGREFVKL